jgi:hypothetical protein
MSALEIHGRCIITDESGNIILDKTNAVHPQNMARVIARGLAHESSYWVNSIAFGDGGTTKVNNVRVHKTPNDGIAPDMTGWLSTLYHETYREVVDDHTSGMVGIGNYADTSLNPPGFEHDINSSGVVSLDDGFKSRVVVNCSLNYNEPVTINGNSIKTQQETGVGFTFDEIALYSGISKSLWGGYEFVDVSLECDELDTGLDVNSTYVFDILIGSVIRHYSITTPATGTGTNGAISYYDLLNLLNVELVDQVVVDMVDISPNLITPRKLNK